MTISFDITDANGNQLETGDKVELFDWGKPYNSLGVVTIAFDTSEGRICCIPNLVEDAYDFVSKALPRSRKI